MKFDVLHNFISPVTGRILADPNYVLVGNSVGIATPSPALIDLRLDLINLRRDYNVATTASFVIGFSNLQLPNAQVLSSLIDGVMINTGGIVSTTAPIDLGFAPNDATYIIQVANPELSNAQALDALGTGLTKLVTNGVVAIAIANIDYVTIAKLNEYIDEANAAVVAATLAAQAAAQAAASAALSASAASASAASALTSAAQAEEAALNAGIAAGIAVTAATEATAAAAIAQGAEISAENSANEAQDSAEDAQDSLDQLLAIALNDLPVTDDVNMSGYRITNLQQSPEEDFDAISMTFLWDLMHDRVEILWP